VLTKESAFKKSQRTDVFLVVFLVVVILMPSEGSGKGK